MTSEGSSALLAANVVRQPLLQRGLMNFQPYNKSLKDWSLGKQLILFPSMSRESTCFENMETGFSRIEILQKPEFEVHKNRLK